MVTEGSADMIPRVDLPSKLTGVDMGSTQANPPQGNALFDDAVFNKAFDDGIEDEKHAMIDTFLSYGLHMY